MMGTADPQPSMFYHINLEQYVTADHPRRKIRLLIDAERIRQLCEPLYAETGRPSIRPSNCSWRSSAGIAGGLGARVSARAHGEPGVALVCRAGCR